MEAMAQTKWQHTYSCMLIQIRQTTCKYQITSKRLSTSNQSLI